MAEMDERQRRFLRENLKKANQAKRELGQLRQELREGVTDPYELLAGSDDRWEPRIENMEVQKVLKLIPGIGTSRMIDVLMALDIPPTSKLRTFSWQRRRKLADTVRDVLEIRV